MFGTHKDVLDNLLLVAKEVSEISDVNTAVLFALPLVPALGKLGSLVTCALAGQLASAVEGVSWCFIADRPV